FESFDRERSVLSQNGCETFACVGRLVIEKGLPLLLKAVGRLKNEEYKFSLKIVGDRPERAQLECLASALGLCDTVVFTGTLTGNALQETLRGISALVMPSICEETAGLAAIEQMIRGRLVIVSDIGGLGEVVDGAGVKFAA